MKRLVKTSAFMCLAALSVALVLGVTTTAGEAPKKIRIIYTNDTLGYLESCGCGGQRSGGLARRAGLIPKLKSENPNTVIVESGNLTNMADRLDLVASILAGMGYDAVGVGETDIRTCGEDFFKKTAANKLTVLDASPNAHPSTVPYLIKNVGGVKVGIISFGYTAPAPDIDESAKRKSLYAAYKAARKQSDILIVLDQAHMVDKDWIERNEKHFGAPDIVIGGVRRQFPEQEQIIGKTHIVPTSVQGKHVGVVDVELDPSGEHKFTWKKIAVEPPDVPEDPVVAARVKEFLNQIQRPPTYTPPQPGSTDQTMPTVTQALKYYHPLMCISCHPKEYEDWAKTKHAKAIATLDKEQRMIPECLKCHSELYRRLNRVPNSTDQPSGVECATCHFGSLPHGVERRHVTTRVKVNPKICTECHDKQWSPNYDEKSYMAKISHLGTKASDAGSAPDGGTSKSSPAHNNHSQPTPSEQEKPTTPPPLPSGPTGLK